MKRTQFKNRGKRLARTEFKRRIRLDADNPTLPSLLRKRRSGRTVLKADQPLRRKRNPEARKWSREVLKRDNYRCQWPGGCTTGDARIDPHHKAKRSQRPDLRYSVDTGIALCRTHHQWIDTHHDQAVAMNLLDLESYELAAKNRAKAA